MNYKKEFDILWNRVAAEMPSTIKSPTMVLPLLAKYRKSPVEKFIVVTLDGNHKVIKSRVITTGLVNRTIVHPREIFRGAIADNAVAVIIAHNHPSGAVSPSDEDKDITKRLRKAGEVVGIKVLDHLIVSKYGYCSFVEEGILY